MTDAVQVGTEWVPPIGMLEELPSEHAATIRGLFELAAFVADHPELRAPVVEARFHLRHDERPQGPEAEYVAERALVDRLAAALGVEPVDQTAVDGHYLAERFMGSVEVSSAAIPPARWARFRADHSYNGCVQPDEDAQETTGDPMTSVGGVR
ncbi:hypothetical protein JOF29_005695 [Kribbella aluminosa]|uniref:Uncharacterized protein n=1 Tax=Kribbella aluminosa TaxID=416017 RepID=A0ABS4USI0_9ACTN|nr:hypothetical protein [Kribbella aluminosa]MBP2354585.1 hypothetical protein [Kribbella aluminosa]